MLNALICIKFSFNWHSAITYQLTGLAGAKLMAIFTTVKILWAKQALLPAAGEIFLKFKIAIHINCLEKMLIWGHFRGIVELLLNIYLGHFLIIGKIFVFLFIESAIKPTPLLQVNVQMPWHTEYNRSNCRWPECFYEPASPVTTPKSGHLKLTICAIHQSYRWMRIHAESDKSVAHGRTWVFQKAYRQLQLWIVN